MPISKATPDEVRAAWRTIQEGLATVDFPDAMLPALDAMARSLPALLSER